MKCFKELVDFVEPLDGGAQKGTHFEAYVNPDLKLQNDCAIIMDIEQSRPHFCPEEL
jgi:hypothetical protein